MTGIYGFSEKGFCVFDMRRVVLVPFDNNQTYVKKLKPDVYYCNHCYGIIYHDDLYFKVEYGDSTKKDFCKKCCEGLCYAE